MANTGWPHDGIYDNWKTGELIVQGTLPARSRKYFLVRTGALRYNERDDLAAAFARLQVLCDNSAEAVREGVVFTSHGVSALVEGVRRHNIIQQVAFTLENMTERDIVLNGVNPTDDTGQVPPRGLLFALGGEPGAPLWRAGQTRAAQPDYGGRSGGFRIVTRFNQRLVARVFDLATPPTGPATVTLAPQVLTFPKRGTNYHVLAKFDGAGRFRDTLYLQAARFNNPDLKVTAEENSRLPGMASWLVFVPSGAPGASAYQEVTATVNVSLRGDWAGEPPTEPIAATWGGPVIVE